jgi:AraC-like DNA-binding protein
MFRSGAVRQQLSTVEGRRRGLREVHEVREVRAASLTGFIEVSYFVGLDPFELLRRAKISPGFLDDPENRHAARPVTEMIENAAAQSGCEAFGLLMAECRSFASLGPLSLLLQHLPNVGEVLDALNDYRRLMNDVVSLECLRGVESSAFCWIVAPGFEKPQTIDLAVGVGYRILTAALGGRWAPEMVHFRHPPPSDLKRFQQFFSVPIEFNARFSGYSCTSASLEAAVPAAEPTMAYHARRLLELVPMRGEHMPISDAAHRAISLLLPGGGAKLGVVAANLGMNGRTLQRRLALEGTSFETLLNETRKDVAKRLLAASAQSIGFIAEMVGYSSTASFTRWFASEFGKSPSRWRKQG